MVEKLILLVTRELADEKHRPLVIGILLAPLFLIVGIILLVVGAFSFFTVTLGTFLTEDTSLVGETVAAMDKARDAYVEEQMALYRQRTDRNGKPYRNVVLQWENGFSNNDKEILTIVSCYYEQDWGSTWPTWQAGLSSKVSASRPVNAGRIPAAGAGDGKCATAIPTATEGPITTVMIPLNVTATTPLLIVLATTMTCM